MRTQPSWITVLVAGALLSATACRSTDGSSTTAEPATTETTATNETAVATTDAITTTTEPAAATPGVELALAGDAQVSAGGGAAAPATDGQKLAAGEVVTTGSTPATLLFEDGSIIRLDVASEFEVGGDTRGTLRAGRAWNRVAAQTEADGFVIETVTTSTRSQPVARFSAIPTPGKFTAPIKAEAGTVTAKGTAFVLDCTADPTMCGVTVLEGTVEVSDGSMTGEVAAPSTSNVLDGLSGASLPINWDMAFGDPFVLESANLDATLNADFVTAGVLGQQLGASFASVESAYLAIRTVTDCQPDPDRCQGSSAIGDVAERTYTFSLDCSAGYPCQGIALTEVSSGGQTRTEVVPLEYDGTTLTWVRDAMEPVCAVGGVEHGSKHNLITWVLTPNAAELVDGKYVMTGGTGTASALNDYIDRSICTAGDYRSYTQFSDVEIIGRV